MTKNLLWQSSVVALAGIGLITIPLALVLQPVWIAILETLIFAIPLTFIFARYTTNGVLAHKIAREIAAKKIDVYRYNPETYDPDELNEHREVNYDLIYSPTTRRALLVDGAATVSIDEIDPVLVGVVSDTYHTIVDMKVLESGPTTREPSKAELLELKDYYQHQIRYLIIAVTGFVVSSTILILLLGFGKGGYVWPLFVAVGLLGLSLITLQWVRTLRPDVQECISVPS